MFLSKRISVDHIATSITWYELCRVRISSVKGVVKGGEVGVLKDSTTSIAIQIFPRWKSPILSFDRSQTTSYN